MHPGLELVKWLAFAAMVFDHADLALFDRGVPWMHQVGRFAFPAFAVSFALGLVRSRDPFAVASRLVVPGLVAHLAWLTIPGGPGVNVLLVFAAVAVVFGLVHRSRAAAVVAALALGAASPVLEYGWLGLLLVGGVVAAFASRRPLFALFAVVPFGGVLASPGVVAGLAAPFLAPLASGAFPRVPGLLAWAYAAHLAVLAACRAFVG